MNFSLVIPCYNELDSIDILIDKTKHIRIKNYKKTKNIVTFLTIQYGSFEKYIESESYFTLNNNQPQKQFMAEFITDDTLF